MNNRDVIIKSIAQKTAMYFANEGGIADALCAQFLLSVIVRDTKTGVEYRDVGYDYSSYPIKTNDRYSIKDYKTVGALLSEANGLQEATYVSGYGLAAQTLEDSLLERYREWLDEWWKEAGMYEQLLDPGENYETIDDRIHDYLCEHEAAEYNWIERVSKLNLRGFLALDETE